MRLACSLRSRVSAKGVWAQVYEITAYKNEYGTGTYNSSLVRRSVLKTTPGKMISKLLRRAKATRREGTEMVKPSSPSEK